MKFTALIPFVLFFITCSLHSTQEGHSFYPEETDEVLVNPHMGFEYFHRITIPSGVIYPESRIVYYRWYWKDFEPESNQIRFTEIDSLLEQLSESNMTLSFRLMAAGNYDYSPGSQLPDWLMDLGIAGTWYGIDGATNCFMPDFADSVMMSNVRRVIAAFGAKYDGDSRISHVDVGWIGHWGEWHILPAARTNGAEPPDWEIRRQYVQWMLEAFPNTYVIAQINDTNALAEACISNNGGWRADSFGDLKPGWNHMNNMYPKHIAAANIGDVWKTAPVCMETGGVISNWFLLNWDVEEIFDRGVEEFHVSVFNAKSSSIPFELMDEVTAFLKRLGYRFVLKQLTLPDTIHAGDTVDFAAVWENKGCAPAYYDYIVKYRIQDGEGHTVQEWSSSTDVKAFLPGTHQYTDTFTFSSGLADGDYQFFVGMFWQDQIVYLAIAGETGDGWYDLGTLTLS